MSQKNALWLTLQNAAETCNVHVWSPTVYAFIMNVGKLVHIPNLKFHAQRSIIVQCAMMPTSRPMHCTTHNNYNNGLHLAE